MLKTLRTLFIAAALSGVAVNVFAEDPGAPVYDADSLSSQSVDEASSEPPPPQTAPAPQPKQFHAESQQQFEPVAQPDDSSAQQLTIDQRVRKVEQQVTNIQTATASSKVEELQNEIQALRGQVDDLTHQLQKLQEKQVAQQQSADAIEKRVNKIATAKTEETPVTPKKDDETPIIQADKPQSVGADKPAEKVVAAQTDDGGAQPNLTEEQQTYQTAYDLIKAKKYNDAIAALQKMLQKYPSGQSAVNAHYWLGELYGLTGKNDQSITEFSSIVKNFPESAKVPDAQLKLGMIYSAELKWTQAKSAFKRVINGYPGTPSARLAQQQLKQIKQAGH